MPKEVIVIDEFHGGEDSNSDPRTISMESSSKMLNIESVENLETDKKGKLKLSGSFTSAGIDVDNSNPFNYSMNDFMLQSTFLFGQDYNLIRNYGSSTEIAEGDELEYLRPTIVPAVVEDNKFRFYDSSVGRWTLAEDFDLWNPDSTVDPIYFVANGALVIADTNFLNPLHPPQMLKLIKLTMMQYTDDEQDIAEWYRGPAKASAPPDDILNVNGSQSDGFHINLDLTINSEEPMMEHMNEMWLFGASYEIDDSEETDISEDSSGTIFNAVDITPETAPFVDITIPGLDNIKDNYGPRITGIRIYMRILGSQDWYILASLNLKKATWYMPTYSPFHYDLQPTNNIGEYRTIDEGDLQPHFAILPLENYQYYSGRDPFDTEDVQYKTVTVANKRSWIGNIKKGDTVYGDRMMKSVYKQYNVFPEEGWIDVVTDDGDEIIKLEAFADRILQFKKNTLYIINAPVNGGEFLEAQYSGYGIDYPCAATLTPNGVAFANTQGVFLYDSEKIVNLLVTGEIHKVSKSDWRDFSIIPSDDQDGTEIPKALRVGFEPTDDMLHIYNENNQGYKISFINNSISQSKDTSLRSDTANLFTYNNKMYVSSYDSSGYSTVFSVWNNDPQQNTVELITRDFDLGEPSIRKRIYRIWITYRANKSNVNTTGMSMHFATNGSNTFSSTYGDSDGTYGETNGRLMGTGGEWKRAWFKPNSSDVSNIYSIQLKTSSENSSADNSHGEPICHDESFEIDDISVVLRRKRAK